MTKWELIKLLIHRSTEINNEAFLKAIKTILDSKSITQFISLTTAQKNEIKKSQKEIEKNLFLEQAELDHEFKQWLREK